MQFPECISTNVTLCNPLQQLIKTKWHFLFLKKKNSQLVSWCALVFRHVKCSSVCLQYSWCVNRGAERSPARSHIAALMGWWLETAPPSACSPLPHSRCSTGTETPSGISSSLPRQARRWPSACRSDCGYCGWGGSGASKHRCLDFCADSGHENHTRSRYTALLPWRRWGGIDSANSADKQSGWSSWSGEKFTMSRVSTAGLQTPNLHTFLLTSITRVRFRVVTFKVL